MALEDDLKSRTSGLVSQQMANWVVEIQRAIQGHQAALVRALDELGEDVARYDEKIDEAQIGAAIVEVLQQSGGVGDGGGGGADYSALKTSIAAIEQGSNLSEVLTHLVNEVTKFVERGAMFIVKAQNAVGWYGAGVENPDIVKTISIPMTADTVFRIAHGSRRAEKGHISQSPETAQALSRLGGGAGGYLVIPLILRDKVAAILYCDTLAPEVPAVKADAIEILVAFAGKVIDVLSSARTGNTSPGLRSQPPTSAPPAPAPAAANEGPQTVMFGTGTIKPQPPPPVVSPPPTPPPPAPPPAAAPAPAPAAPPVRAMTPEQQKAHDDARRFARLVVSEIKLYNEAKVAEGRKTKDIYERLKEDVERGRQMYNDRVAADIRDATDYFQDELVRILGGGDASALGAQ
jgi:hypothetical protein